MGFGCVRRIVAISVAAVALSLGIIASGFAVERPGEPLFTMRDPSGDDWGAGRINYPRNEAFHPYTDLLDLLAFTVRKSSEGVVFDFEMGRLSNPWDAPEGFFHPRIDVYIHTGDEGGRVEPLRPGPGVRFSDRHPWHLWLRVAPFGGTALFTWEDMPQSPGRHGGISVTSSPERATISVRFAPNVLPPPDEGWRYYVVVGSFDGFGADGYRGIGKPDNPWLLGSVDAGVTSRVVDLLAPSWGPRRQERQLAERDDDTIPTIRPIGGRDIFRYSPRWVLFAFTLPTMLALWILLRGLHSKSRSRRSGG